MKRGLGSRPIERPASRKTQFQFQVPIDREIVNMAVARSDGRRPELRRQDLKRRNAAHKARVSFKIEIEDRLMPAHLLGPASLASATPMLGRQSASHGKDNKNTSTIQKNMPSRPASVMVLSSPAGIRSIYYKQLYTESVLTESTRSRCPPLISVCAAAGPQTATPSPFADCCPSHKRLASYQLARSICSIWESAYHGIPPF
jgi:hypothetical protein